MGVVIAVMLGRLRMSTAEALHEYTQLVQKVFSPQNKKWPSFPEKYRATALQEAVEDIVRRRNMGEYLLDSTLREDSKGQCFVCVVSVNYVGKPPASVEIDLLRSLANAGDRHSGPGVKIWEAARACAASPFYFKKMTLKLWGRPLGDYIDAATYRNNPSTYLIDQAMLRMRLRRFGCLVSIGAGTRSATGGSPSKNPIVRELLEPIRNFPNDGEAAHRLFRDPSPYPNMYFRFNVPDVAAEVQMDDWVKMEVLKGATSTGYLPVQAHYCG